MWALLSRLFEFRDRPHLLLDYEARFNHTLADLREDNLAVWVDEIVMAFQNMRTDEVNVEKA